jgi:hypothetical protein
MKKVLAILALFMGILILQSCGGAEKCPAYSSVEQAEVLEA